MRDGRTPQEVRADLCTRIRRVQKEIEILDKVLNNRAFATRAPARLVEQKRQRRKEWVSELDLLLNEQVQLERELTRSTCP
jgi:valyl-tRNA synthetase